MVEDVPAPSIERSDPWDRTAYEDWVTRLGAERMQGFLAKLREQFRCLLVGLEDPNDMSIAWRMMWPRPPECLASWR